MSNPASFLNGGPDVAGSDTLLSLLVRTPGTAADAERAVGEALADGRVTLTGTLRSMTRADWREALTDGR